MSKKTEWEKKTTNVTNGLYSSYLIFYIIPKKWNGLSSYY